MKRILFISLIALLPLLITACTNSQNKSAYSVHQLWLEANEVNLKIDSVDALIHQYNLVHDAQLLQSALDRLDPAIKNGCQNQALLVRKMSIFRLLHEYDTVQAILDAYQDTNDVVLCHRMQTLLTDISKHNYYHQEKELEDGLNNLVSFLELCFERQSYSEAGNEEQFLQKYPNNPLAIDAKAADHSPLVLDYYIVARLLRGDDPSVVEKLINEYSRDGLIGDITQELLLSRLTQNYSGKDFDMLL